MKQGGYAVEKGANYDRTLRKLTQMVVYMGSGSNIVEQVGGYQFCSLQLLCRPRADTEPVLPASRPNAKNQNHHE